MYVDAVEVQDRQVLGASEELLGGLPLMKTKTLVVSATQDPLDYYGGPANCFEKFLQPPHFASSSLTTLQCDVIPENLLVKLIDIHKHTLMWVSFVTHGLGAYVEPTKVIESLRAQCKVQILHNTMHKFWYGNLCSDEKEIISMLVSAYPAKVNVFCTVCDCDKIVSIKVV